MTNQTNAQRLDLWREADRNSAQYYATNVPHHNQDWVDLREMGKDDSMWSSMMIIMRVVRMSEAGENKCYQKHVRYENNNTE